MGQENEIDAAMRAAQSRLSPDVEAEPPVKQTNLAVRLTLPTGGLDPARCVVEVLQKPPGHKSGCRCSPSWRQVSGVLSVRLELNTRDSFASAHLLCAVSALDGGPVLMFTDENYVPSELQRVAGGPFAWYMAGRLTIRMGSQ